jgi:hypothetical protein
MMNVFDVMQPMHNVLSAQCNQCLIIIYNVNNVTNVIPCAVGNQQ